MKARIQSLYNEFLLEGRFWVTHSDSTSFYALQRLMKLSLYIENFYTLHYGWIFHRIASDCWTYLREFIEQKGIWRHNLCVSPGGRQAQLIINSIFFCSLSTSPCAPSLTFSQQFICIYIERNMKYLPLKISNMQYKYLQVFIEQWIWIWRGSQGSLSKNISLLSLYHEFRSFVFLLQQKKIFFFIFFRIISIYLYRLSSLFFCFISYYCEV